MEKEIRFNEKCARDTSYIALCAAAALLSCLWGELGAFAWAAEFVGDIAVMAMFTLYFAMTARAFSEAYPEHRSKIRRVSDCAALLLNTAFTALCAINGGIVLHAAALGADIVFSRIYADSF